MKRKLALLLALVFVFSAAGCKSSKGNSSVTESYIITYEDEYVDVEFCRLEELMDMIYTGKITDGKTIAGILAYANKR